MLSPLFHSLSNTTLFSYRTLYILVIINILTTILHYVDNVIFFQYYPEPDWLQAHWVDAFWFVMTPFAILSLFLFKQQKIKLAISCLISYVLMSLLVLGHYHYAPFFDISLKIHAFIWIETIAAIILAIYAILYTEQQLKYFN